MTGTAARGYFITGTDTGVGKTEIACGLIRIFGARGLAVAGMKPIAAGARRIDGELRNGDVERLLAAVNVRVARHLMNPYLLAMPVAPHLAAERTGRRIDLRTIMRAYRAISARSDIVIVEGVGGLLVPLNERCDTADLARRMRLPVLVVVGMRLGCLSHALLTAAVLAARGLTFAGWFANRIDPRMREYRGNVEALRRRLRAPLLGEIAYRSNPAARRIAIDRALERSRIVQSPV